MANTNYAFLQRPRIATHKRTGEVFFVTYFDINNQQVHTAGHLLAYQGTTVKKFAIDRKFRRDEVELRDITIEPEILHVLFEQARATPEMQKLLMSGDLIAQVRRDKMEAKFTKRPASAIPHQSLVCPHHNVPLLLRTFNGGQFFGCASYGETSCNVKYSDEQGWKNTDETNTSKRRGKKDESVQDIASAAE